MKRQMRACVLAGIAAAMFSGVSVPAYAKNRPRTDHALFDGTNPANVNAGVLCFVNRGRAPAPWTLHVSVSSFGGSGFKLIYKDGDFVPFQVPSGTSFSLSQAGGSNSSSIAIRIDNSQDPGAAGLAGAVSGASSNGVRVTCLSCDNDADGDAACDAIIPN